MLKKILVIVLLMGLSFFAGLKCQSELSELDEIGEPSIRTIKFKNETFRETIYLVTKRWGLTGDHQVFALTKAEPLDNHWMPDQSKDLIWQGDNSIFYQQRNDTIKIFSLQLPDKKQDLKTKHTIEVKQIDGATFHKLRNQVDTAIKVIE